MGIMDKFRLDGEVAVVTGAGKGIGRAIAMGLAEAGADVALASRTQTDLEDVAEEIRALGRRAMPLATDATDFDALEKLAGQTIEELGKLSIWVNNAGGIPDGTPRYPLFATLDERQTLETLDGYAELMEWAREL